MKHNMQATLLKNFRYNLVLLMWETKGLSQGMSCEIHQDLYGPLRNVKEQRLQKKIQKEKLWDLQPCSSHLGCILVSASRCLISVLKFSSWLQALRWSPRDAGGDAPSVGLPWAQLALAAGLLGGIAPNVSVVRHAANLGSCGLAVWISKTRKTKLHVGIQPPSFKQEAIHQLRWLEVVSEHLS